MGLLKSISAGEGDFFWFKREERLPLIPRDAGVTTKRPSVSLWDNGTWDGPKRRATNIGLRHRRISCIYIVTAEQQTHH